MNERFLVAGRGIVIQEMPCYSTDYARSLIELGSLEKDKEWSTLEARAKKILAQCPVSVNAMMGLGRALEKQGKVDEAVDCYESAIAVLRPRRKPHAHFMKRLDILYRRLRKWEDCFQVCLYYADAFPYSPDAFHRLARAASHVEKNELRDAAKALEKKLEEPTTPRDEPLKRPSDEELDSLARITDEDIQRAIEGWNRTIPEAAGLLEAKVYSGRDLQDSDEFVEEETDLRVEPKPRQVYTDGDIEQIGKALSERLRKYG